MRSSFTFIELIFSLVILGILANTALPLSEKVMRKEREFVLKERLGMIRKAIDRYYVKEDQKSYPPDLQSLVDRRFLRRVPRDPMTGGLEWQLIASIDAPGEKYSGHDVFDVRSLSKKRSLRGDFYADW